MHAEDKRAAVRWLIFLLCTLVFAWALGVDLNDSAL